MEYVSKKEVKPYKKIFAEKIELIRNEVRDQEITITYVLVGSAKRNLVVRHHNKGFDCDYRITIQKNKKNHNEKKIKEIFIQAFNNAFCETDFECCNDSSSAITLKIVDEKSSKIIFGYDVVIVSLKDHNFEILRYLKKDNIYKFESLPSSKNHIEKVKEIKGSDMWQKVRDNYLKKKENNEISETSKKSFQLFIETINEVAKC